MNDVVVAMMAAGSFFAERVRAEGASALDRLVGPQHVRGGDLGDVLTRFIRRRRHDWAVAWHNNGYPRVTLGHRHAASLMSTHTNPESISDARAPWSAFLLDIPYGLIEYPVKTVCRVEGTETISGTKTLHAALALVLCDVDRIAEVYIYGSDGEYRSMLQTDSLEKLGAFKHADPGTELVARLVLGVCLEMTTPTYKGARSVGPQPIRRDPRTGEPRTWVFRLSRDVKVDCRDVVRDYCRGVGSASAPSVQCLVRGHWKHQPCGKGSEERKYIFVEPYWRGPEDAPIAMRKHRRHGNCAVSFVTGEETR